ncbi:hypothetical protein [Candidatus Poriferisodalis sp.]|uniref:hypothetical protein n=1 Tax=Candidatus Poriferisodalis sp. TaxID=3101277 RepID=UPI003B525876
MRYPTLSRNVAVEVAEARIARQRSQLETTGASGDGPALGDLAADLVGKVGFRGEGEEFPHALLETARRDIETLARPYAPRIRGALKDPVEGRTALVLHQAISDSGAGYAVLDDPGFWRHMAMAYLWNFAVWREHGTFFPKPSATGEPEVSSAQKFAVYIDGRRFHECVPTRMWLRVNVLGGQELDLAYKAHGGTDFWRSHILRVKAGEHPGIVRAMARRQADEATRLTTGPLREFAKQLNRTLQNLVPAMLDDEAADLLVEELWERQLQ